MNNDLNDLKETWDNIEQTAKDIKLPENDARLYQQTAYVGTLLNSCNISLLCRFFQEKTRECKEAITELQNNVDDTTITKAYNTLHETIICIFPYVINTPVSAAAATDAISKYQSTVEDHIKVIEDKKKEIDSLDLENKKLVINKIEDYYTKLFENENSIETQINQAQELCTQFNSSYDSIKPQIKEIQKYKSDIFDENGLKQEISNIVNEVKEKQSEIKELTAAVDELLPGAISAGLASAYNELKISHEKQVNWHNNLFFGSITALSLSAIVCFINPYSILEPLNTTDIIKWTQLLVQRVLLVSPLLWLILFSLKRRSECMRLQQEYAHKEAVTKSYVSFKKQIDGMQNTNTSDYTSLTKQLLEIAISTISFNASSTLDKNHNDKLPIQEIGERIVNATKK